MKHRQYSEAERRTAVEQWQGSGQSAARWARERGISGPTFHGWRQQQRMTTTTNALPLRLAEVIVAKRKPGRPLTAIGQPSSWQIVTQRSELVITQPGLRIVIEAGAEAALVQRLITALVPR